MSPNRRQVGNNYLEIAQPIGDTSSISALNQDSGSMTHDFNRSLIH